MTISVTGTKVIEDYQFFPDVFWDSVIMGLYATASVLMRTETSFWFYEILVTTAYVVDLTSKQTHQPRQLDP